MISYTLNKETSTLHIQLAAALEKEDFIQLAKTLDPYIEQSGPLKGLLLEAPSFPGWASFGALIQHLRFVHDHHRRIEKIGVVTDSVIGNLAEHVASHFVAAEIRHFPAAEIEAARQWVSPA